MNFVVFYTILWLYKCVLNFDLDKNTLEANKFWDAVIISASDESQMKGYKKQIAKKQLLKEIPLGVPFHVFADPPGYKIGNFFLFNVLYCHNLKSKN